MSSVKMIKTSTSFNDKGNTILREDEEEKKGGGGFGDAFGGRGGGQRDRGPKRGMFEGGDMDIDEEEGQNF